MAWLRERTALQRNPAGLDYFALESSWQSQSVYFTGPDGLILELIGRRRLPGGTRQGAFHGGELTCLSEVGLPSHDVDSVREQASQRFGLQPISPPSPQFAPMGADAGLLIVVAADRRWFPAQKDLPNAQGLQLQVGDVGGAGVLPDAPPPPLRPPPPDQSLELLEDERDDALLDALREPPDERRPPRALSAGSRVKIHTKYSTSVPALHPIVAARRAAGSARSMASSAKRA
ncbi:hypothetical protein G6F68_012782 [Rhizopus microsporus]|nr:hypothetical protein G6F68_012782 [Rhizopus microsporus]